MNEDHIIAAILTVGLLSRASADEMQPREVVGAYELVLAELLSTRRPPRGDQEA